MIAYVTKYCLTKGIMEVECTISENSPEMICVPRNDAQGWVDYYHGEGKDWHRTREAAAHRATKVRNKCIHSLRKKILKLEAITFS